RRPDSSKQVPFQQELRRRLSALPGVKAVAISAPAPLLDDNSMSGFWVEGRERPARGEGLNAYQYTASPAFLAAMGAHLIKGRDLREDDDLKSMVTVIDDNLAHEMFGDEDPIGHHIAF